MSSPKDEEYELMTSRRCHPWYAIGEPAPLHSSLHLTNGPLPQLPTALPSTPGPLAFRAHIHWWGPSCSPFSSRQVSLALLGDTLLPPTQLGSHSKYGQRWRLGVAVGV